MRYKIPKFLERETKFFNFFTFKQLGAIGGVVLVLVLLYYILPQAAFLPIAIISGGGILALFGINVEGMPLGKRIVQFMGYFTDTSVYIWQRRRTSHPIQLKKEVEKEEKEEEEESPLKVAPKKSSIQRLSSKVDLGFRE